MYDVIIVGGGVAAFTAALFTGRRGLKVLVIGKDIGGQANYTDTIENFPGLPAVGGYELVSSIRSQAEKWGSEYLEAEVTRIKSTETGFVVTAYGSQYKSKTVILAFGKTPRDLGVPGEDELKGRGVSFCATCDAPLYKGKTVAVAGVGDVSLDAILLCSKYSKKVYALSKTDRLQGHPGLVKAISRKTNVELVPFIQIQEVVGTTQLEKLKLHDLATGQQRDLPIHGLFVELGYVVNADFVKDLVQLDDQSQIVVGADQSTNMPGIFAAGDVTNRHYKQAAISAGEAATAALACYDYLARLEGRFGLTSDWTQIKRVK
ncbi:MAG: FAD-dependent oxidoreductase [Candidatus Doudnabacteria bacterium]|nr:FAD-dependent oxidoreductase [Candidatus Doudnabacteria bacterium]